MTKKQWFSLAILGVMLLTHVLMLFIPTYHFSTYFSIIRPFIYIGLVVWAWLALGKTVRIYSGVQTLVLVAILGLVLYIGFNFVTGWINGFGNNAMNTTLPGILNNAWSYVLLFLIREFLRSKILVSVGERYKWLWVIGVTLIFNVARLDNLVSVMRFGIWQHIDWILTFLLPTFVLNLWLSYSASYDGMISNMIFMVGHQAILLFSPILPDVMPILDAIALYCIVFIMFIIYDSVEWVAKRSDGINVTWQEKRQWGWTILPGVFLVVCVMFGLGVFPVIPVAVASNSMLGEFSRGDLVYVRRTEPELLQEGDILQYSFGNITIIHRIVRIGHNWHGQRYFVTQGDANPSEDLYPVFDDQVIGRAVARTHWMGWPALLLWGLRQ
jgi:signal peptidase